MGDKISILKKGRIDGIYLVKFVDFDYYLCYLDHVIYYDSD
jgi:hypothetical protein